MNIKTLLYVALTCVCYGSLSSAYAINEECLAVQDCVDNELPITVNTCVEQHTSCSAENSDRFALSAGVLADRALALKDCETRQFSSKKRCLACFGNATRPLRHRYDGSLFHGLLGNATRQIQYRGVTYCSSFDN